MGFNLYSPLDTSINAGCRLTVYTDIQLTIPQGYFGKIETHLQMASGGIIVLGGIVDCKFRGNIGVTLMNLCNETVYINRSDLIGQLIMLPLIQMKINVKK